MTVLLRRLLSWLAVALSGAYIAYFFSANGDDLRLLLSIRPEHVVALILLQVLYLLLHGYRYRIVLEQCSDRSIAYWPWFRLFVLGRFLNTVLPQSGNLYRGLLLKDVWGVTYTRYVTAFFSFAWMGNCLNLLIALAMVALVDPGLRVGVVPAGLLVASLLLALAGLPVLLDRFSRGVRIRARYVSWIHDKVSEVLRVSVGNLRDARYLRRMLGFGLLAFAAACTIFGACFHGLGISVGFAEMALFYVILQISTHVHVTPGNLGVQELGFGILGEQMGIGMGEGMLVSALLRVSGYLALFALAVPMGGVRLLRGGAAKDAPMGT